MVVRFSGVLAAGGDLEAKERKEDLGSFENCQAGL